MTAPRRRPSYSLGWGTPLKPSDALLLAGDPINNSSRHPHDVSRYVAPFSAAPRPFHTRIIKIGLIDPDDPTEEEEGSHVDKRQHKLHGWSIGLADAINQKAFASD